MNPFTFNRATDFPRSRKTDGKHGNNHWKRKTLFQTEKHGNVLLTTCCTEICNNSQRKNKNVAFIHSLIKYESDTDIGWLVEWPRACA